MISEDRRWRREKQIRRSGTSASQDRDETSLHEAARRTRSSPSEDIRKPRTPDDRRRYREDRGNTPNRTTEDRANTLILRYSRRSDDERDGGPRE